MYWIIIAASLRPWFGNYDRAVQYRIAELATLFGEIQLLDSGGRVKVENLDKPSNHDRQQRHGYVDARASSPARTEGQEPEIIASQLRIAVQESLRNEFLRFVPVLGVIRNPPWVHEDPAACRDIVAKELRWLQI